jgi:hypothetical protein
VNDGHRATRSSWTNLLAKHAILTWRDWRMVKTAGVNRHFIPVLKSIEGIVAVSERMSFSWSDLARRSKARAPDTFGSARLLLRKYRRSSNREGDHKQGER